MKINQDVLTVLSASRTEGNNLFLTGSLDRKLYTKTNEILEACGGRWNRKAKAHVFPTSAEERLEQILETGEIEIPKADFDYFPTPSVVVERLLEIAEVQQGMKVLEPSAGQGAIAIPVSELGAAVTCFELAKTNYEALKVKAPTLEIIQGDFLEQAPAPVYDRVVMNPPFGRQQDIKHVNHAYKFLKPEGMLVAVMASSVLWRENRLTTEFREFVYSKGGSIEKLPEASFRESGTLVGTVIASIPA